MQYKKDHFIIDQNAITQGQCTSFISQSEQLWRTVDILEEPPFKRVSAYTRNVQYQAHNTRTFSVLKQTLKYLISEIFPLIFDPKMPLKDREHAVLFLQERIIAIRCEYFVQGIICPGQLLKILKCMVIIDILRGFNNGNRPLVGLQLMMQAQSRQIMEKQFTEQYFEVLKISLLCSKRRDIHKVLLDHPIIMQNQQLFNLLQMKMKIESNNYHIYYNALEEEEPLIRSLLWLQIINFKKTFKDIVRKSFLNLPSKWIFRRLCIDCSEQNSWINVKDNSELFQKEEQCFEKWISLETLRKVILN